MQRLTSLFAAALLCGCAVGPDVQVPAPPDDTGYVPGPQPVATVAADGADAAGQAHAQTLAAGADVPAQWWMLVRSPELDATLRNALDASPTLAQARARLREAQENLAARTGATRWPAVDAKLNTTRQQGDFQSLGITAIPSPGPFTL